MIVWTICLWLVGAIVALFLLGVVLLILTLIVFGISYVYAKVRSKENWTTKILKD